MSFSHAWVLAFLLVPMALFVWELRRRGRAVSLPFDHSLGRTARFLPGLLPGTLRALTLVPAVLLAVAVIMLAGPKRLGPPGQDRVLTNIEFCLDVSGSMSSPMSAGEAGSTRYTTAMAAINYFTKRREGDAFGLTIFGVEVIRWVPLTKDLSAIRNATPFLDPQFQPPQLRGTRVGNALKYCNQILAAQSEGDRLIVILTDGESPDLDGGAATQIASELASNNVVVHAIYVGDGNAPNQLSDAVLPTGGQVLNATNLSTLTACFDHIDRMHKIQIKPTQREAIDFFAPFSLAGLACIALWGCSLLGLRYTPW